MIIAAHNYKSHFGSLDRLAVGDEVEFLDTFGQKHLYEVCELAELDGTAVSDMHAGGWDFTLFTCTKSGEQRVAVRCNKKQ
jgi:sortase A